MAYDDQNIFAKILRGEIPNATVYEDDFVLAFKDISPQRAVHILVIPKGPYEDLTAFTQRASDAELAGYMRALGKVADIAGVADAGYRVISNIGDHGHQEVPHLHFHLLGGEPAGPMLKRNS